MEQKSLTALISAFSRAYHALNNEVTIFNDSLARDLLTDEEFNQIAKNMSNGIGFFNPSFVGEPEQALRWVVDNQLNGFFCSPDIFSIFVLLTGKSLNAVSFAVVKHTVV